MAKQSIRPFSVWITAISFALILGFVPSQTKAAFEQAGSTLHIREDIVRGDSLPFLQALTETIRRTEQQETIVLELNSYGGDLEAALFIAGLISTAQESGRTIRATVPKGGRCDSACVVIFAAADDRTAASDAQFLLHGVTYAGIDQSTRIAQRHGELVNSMQDMIDAADPAFGHFIRRHKIIEYDLNMTFSAAQLHKAFGSFITRLSDGS